MIAEYPIVGSGLLYMHYRERADAIPGLLMCGRLGEYRYYDMARRSAVP